MREPVRIRMVLSLGVCLPMLALVTRWPSARQARAQQAEAPAAAELAVQYYAASDCARCHQTPEGQKPDPLFVKHTEYPDWLLRDKHSDAHLVLLADDRAFAEAKSQRAAQIARIKAAKPEDRDPARLNRVRNDVAKVMARNLPTWDFARDDRCTICHSPAASRARNAKAAADAEAVADGVGCASCHGAHKEWVDEHSKLRGEEAWIDRTAADKRDNFGMNDLRDPAGRAAVCASCHVGDKAAGRVVTHEMYAAGHPPLPGLEVSTFSRAEPPHWLPMKDVPYFNFVKKFGVVEYPKHKERSERLSRQYKVDEFPTQHAKLVAVGGLVTFREAMKLFAETGREADAGPPEFSRFDCAACHHELKVSEDSFRQSRGFASDPGRPPAADWPASLVHVGIAAGDPAQAEARRNELIAGLKRLHAAVGDRPFGDTAKAASEARALASWSDSLIKELDARKLDREAAIRILKEIAAIDEPDHASAPQLTQAVRPPDHASARQLAWAFRAVYDELNPKPANDREIAATIKELIDTLKVGLTPGEQGTVIREVGARLDADEKYDPVAIARLFDRLRELLR